MYTCPLSFDADIARITEYSEGFDANNFLKGSIISPDGSSVLSYSENNAISINKFNPVILHATKYYSDLTDTIDDHSCDVFLSSHSQTLISAGESIFDVKWYPLMNSESPGSNCFITTTRDHPVTLWDADNGTVRATYNGINQLDELDCANSVAFNMTGDRIYAGSNRMIRCFDISRPGRDSTTIPTTKNKKSYLGQKGIISTLAFNPDCSGVYAAGSYSHSIGIYVENSKDCMLQLDNLDYGVTCLKWSPCGNYLWSGGRRSNIIQCWDIRQTGSVVGSVERVLDSNQRITFDLDPWGEYLATGTQSSEILIYNTKTFELKSKIHCEGSSCVNSVSFHPYCAFLVTGSGERSFYIGDSNDLDTDDEDTSVVDAAGGTAAPAIDCITNSITQSVDISSTDATNVVVETNAKVASKKSKPKSVLSVWKIDKVPLVVTETIVYEEMTVTETAE